MDQYLKWHEMLQLAPNTKVVQAVARDYVRELGPLVTALPEPCRAALAGDIDVQAAAVVLLREEMRFEGMEQARDLLRSVAFTFALAAVRIAQLHSGPTPEA